jgi:protein SCO1/2
MRFRESLRLITLALALASGPASATPLPADSAYQLADRYSDQNGRDFVLADGRGRPRVVAMFYTSCRYVCPLIVDSAKGIEHALTVDERGRLRFLLVSLDPARDTTAALKSVADKRRLDPARWTLARTEAGGVRRLAAVLGVRYRALADGEFNHTSALVLLDGDGRVLARTETLGGVPDPVFLAAVRSALAPAAAAAIDAGQTGTGRAPR